MYAIRSYYAAVDLGQEYVEIAGVALRQFRDGVDPRRLEQIGVFLPDPLDAEEVGPVDPFQQQGFADPGLCGQSLAGAGGGAALQ